MNARGTLHITVRLRRVTGNRIVQPWAATCHTDQAASWEYGDTAWEAIGKTIEREKFRKRRR